ncbi:MAG: dTMP kinase [Methanotrichaceae archaeon]|nr:dTMP kinase [Methanotrichaceae archaeon]
MKGQLITLEGIDGSGKSTAARHIASKLAETLPERKLVLTAEPTAGKVGQILREELARANNIETESSAAQHMQELFLFMADHAQHLTKTVLPSLEAGAIVLSDRYADSTAAYQGVTLRGIVPDPVQWIQNIYSPWNLPPDKTLLFVLDPRSALERMQSRQGREKFERLEFLRSVDDNFRRMAALEPQRFVQIDAGQDAENVAEEAIKAILHLTCK